MSGFVGSCFSDRMAEIIKEAIIYMEGEILSSCMAINTCPVDLKEEIIEDEQKEVNIVFKEEPITSPTLENTCTLYVDGEEENIKMEPVGMKGKIL